MNKKDNTITINEKSERNSYKCDISKPFVVIKDTTMRVFLSEFFFDMFGGIFCALSLGAIIYFFITLIRMDIFSMIIWAIVAFVFAVVCVPFFYAGVRKRKKFKNLFSEVKLLVCTTLSLRIEKEEKKYKHYWTVCLEGSNETMEIWINNYDIEPNQKIAIATIGDKEFILTKCALIAI